MTILFTGRAFPTDPSLRLSAGKSLKQAKEVVSVSPNPSKIGTLNLCSNLFWTSLVNTCPPQIIPAMELSFLSKGMLNNMERMEGITLVQWILYFSTNFQKDIRLAFP